MRKEECYPAPLWMAYALGLFIGYCVFTIIGWDVDNEYPNLHGHMTLVHWIWVNQIQHVWHMLHDIW